MLKENTKQTNMGPMNYNVFETNKANKYQPVDRKIRVLTREAQMNSHLEYVVNNTHRYLQRLEQIRKSINKL